MISGSSVVMAFVSREESGVDSDLQQKFNIFHMNPLSSSISFHPKTMKFYRLLAILYNNIKQP